MASYRWAGGEDWDGRIFSSRVLPTDAEIIFRVACASWSVFFAPCYNADLIQTTLLIPTWVRFRFDAALRKGQRGPSFLALHVRESEFVSAGWWGLIDASMSHSPLVDFKPHYKLVVSGNVLVYCDVHVRRWDICILRAKKN